VKGPADKPLITAVIPVGRLSGKLKNLQVTLIQATRLPIEIVIVLDLDDNQIKQEAEDLILSLNSAKIRLFQGVYGSPGNTRNTGMEHVDTKWICFWDADDIVDVENFIWMVYQGDTQKADIVIGSFVEMDFESGEILKSHHLGGTLSSDLVSILANPGLWRFAFRFDAIKGCIFKDWKLAEDQDFLIQSKFWEKDVIVFNKNVYGYNQNVGGQLTATFRKSSEIQKSIESIFSRISQSKHENHSKKVLGILALKQIFTYIRMQSGITEVRIGTQLLAQFFRIFKVIGILSLFLLFRLKASKGERVTSIFLQGGLGNNLFQISAANSLNPQKIRFVLWKEDASRIQPIIEKFSSKKNCETFILRSSFIRRILNLGLRNSIKNYGQKPVKFQTLVEIFLCAYFSFAFREMTKVKFGEDVGWSQIENKNRHYLLVGYFQSYKYLTWPSDLLEISQLLPPPTEEMSLQAIQDCPLVVHVRLGDYRDEPKFGIPSHSYYKNAIEKMMNTGEFKKIWLFSDEPEAALDFIPLNFWQCVQAEKFNHLGSMSTLSTMNLGSGFVIGNSTFGWWGAFLAKIRSAPVIVPEQWFRSITDPVDLIPVKWEKNAPNF
jgi:glycosyltransferase involved in cell wall biosynthesis